MTILASTGIADGVCLSTLTYIGLICIPLSIYFNYCLWVARYNLVVLKRYHLYTFAMNSGGMIYLIARFLNVYLNCHFQSSDSSWVLESGFNLKNPNGLVSITRVIYFYLSRIGVSICVNAIAMRAFHLNIDLIWGIKFNS